MLAIFISSLPASLKTLIKRIVMHRYACGKIEAATVARLIRDWGMGAE